MSSTTSAPSPPQLSSGSDRARTACLNCGTPLSGTFCSNCGQRDVPPHPSLRELGGEAFEEFSGWDGKFIQTLKLLILKPGELTRQFLDGRRARFISPVRLYLSASVIFFLFAARTPASKLHFSYEPAGQQNTRRELVPSDTLFAPSLMRPLIKQAATNKASLIANILDALPKGLFALLPAFAAILMLFYRRRHFTEHLYFAIHVHAFMFVALDTVMVLQRVVRSPTFSLIAVTIVGLWIPVYVHLALVRVYGGSQILTLLKELGISLLYILASLPMIMILAMYVAWSMG